MADELEHHAPAGHYSGRNRIPNIKQFVASLDRDKQTRDAQIDAGGLQSNKTNPGVQEHHNMEKRKKGRIVTDPVTGKQVEIADIDLDFEQAVENPMVSYEPKCDMP